ncbi:hypothetical protein BGZ63DRAFT_402390 [Mariannaea sp. PMI_226]|nr:hypothetical protein BGZ63DRAFT_402390 [Mariannaea sp. PMI_226]
MLAPSPFPCTSQQSSRTLLPAFEPTYHSPPATPPTLAAQRALSNIMNSCRTLQSLVTTGSSQTESPLLTPPLTHAPPPLKLRLRSSGRKPARKEPYPSSSSVRKTTRSPATRRRLELVTKEPVRSSDERRDIDSEDESQRPINNEPVAPSTPKRAHIAPERLPLGLERSDFHNLHERVPMPSNRENRENREHYFPEEEDMYDDDISEGSAADPDMWSVDDDRVLVELILEKLKLSKAEWQDCARHLGRDSDALSRRWKSLMLNGDVGLKRHATRRRGLHSTWR